MKNFSNARIRRVLVLSLCWLFGLYAGYFFESCVSVNSTSLMLSAVDSRMSIVGLLLILILPFVFSAIFLRYSQPFLLFAVVFLKAFSFSWCAFSIIVAFGDAGWLVRWLLMFSDSCSVIFLLWFVFRNTGITCSRFRADLFLCITTCVTIGCVDFCVVSPFAEMLLH